MRWLLLSISILVSDRAWAQEPAPLSAEVVRRGTSTRVVFDVTGAFTEDFRRRFVGGMTSRARIRVFLLGPDRRELAEARRECEMRYDVWDELVRLEIRDGGDVQRDMMQLVDRSIRRCGEVELAIGAPADFARGARLLVEVALNPVSEELLERTREFMSNPRGGGGRGSIFSAIARLFRSSEGAEGETFLFASPPLRLSEGS